MKMPKCPRCGSDCLLLEEEVDIGVGTQRHFIGWECEKCGHIAACNSCGIPLIGIAENKIGSHYTWCASMKEIFR